MARNDNNAPEVTGGSTREVHAQESASQQQQQQPGGNTNNNNNHESHPRRSGRNNNRRSNRQNNNKNDSNPKKAETFNGATAALHGHVFQLMAENPKQNQFEKTVEALDIYASATFSDDAKYLSHLLDKFETPKVEKPNALKANADDTDKEGWKIEVKYWKAGEMRLKQTLHAMYTIIWGQCSQLMKTQVQACATFEKMKKDSDAALLLREIRGISYKFDLHISVYEAIDEAHKRLINCRQQPHDSNTIFLKIFKTNVEVLEHYGGKIGYDTGFTDYEKKRWAEDPLKAALAKPTDSAFSMMAKKRCLATMFLRRVDRNRYAQLLQDLRNQYTLGYDNYPLTLAGAFTMIQNYKHSLKASKPTKPAKASNETPSNG